jgi:DNA-binding LytR/AlgR family response regulator
MIMTHALEFFSPAPTPPAVTPGVLFRALLVEADAAMRSGIVEQMKFHADFEMAATCADAVDAAGQIAALAPELVILDWAAAPELRQQGCLPGPSRALVITAREPHHAAKAFEMEALDYLLKPIAPERLAIAIARVRVQLRAARLAGGGRDAVFLPPPRARTERLVLKRDGEFHFVAPADVVRCEAQGDYVKVFTRTGTHLVRTTLARLGAQLDPSVFMRVHRSHLVNRDYVTKASVRADGDYSLTLGAGGTVPVARAQTAIVRRLLD